MEAERYNYIEPPSCTLFPARVWQLAGYLRTVVLCCFGRSASRVEFVELVVGRASNKLKWVNFSAVR